MNIEIIKQFLTFIILCLAQALVLNHINLFGCATPLLYVYFIPVSYTHLTLPTNREV